MEDLGWVSKVGVRIKGQQVEKRSRHAPALDRVIEEADATGESRRAGESRPHGDRRRSGEPADDRQNREQL